MFSRNYILILTDSLNFYIYWTPTWMEGPINSVLSVRLSVRLQCFQDWNPMSAMFSGLTNYFFLIFWMNLGFNKYMNVTDPSLKILIVFKIGKYKINIFGLFSKSIRFIYYLNIFVRFLCGFTWCQVFNFE